LKQTERMDLFQKLSLSLSEQDQMSGAVLSCNPVKQSNLEQTLNTNEGKQEHGLQEEVNSEDEYDDIYSLMALEEALQVICRLPLDDFFDTMIVPKKWRSTAFENVICRKKFAELSEKGLPAKRRGDIWQLAIKSTQYQFSRVKNLYKQLADQESGFSDQIRRDIGRTFPNNLIFEHPIIQLRLFNLLNANANYHKELGYTQGMALVAGMLMLHMDEEDAFWALVCLSGDKSEISQLWRPGLPGLTKCFYVFEQLLENELPKLYAHFQLEKIDTSSYATGWFMTMFIYVFPIHVAARIMDVFTFEGINFLYAIALSILKILETKLLGATFESILTLLNFRGDSSCINEDELLKMANGWKEKLKPLIPQFEAQYSFRRNTV